MNATEAAALLSVCSSFDNRKPDPDVVLAWSVALADFDFLACRDAVVKHYQRTRDWIMPFDIISEVKRTRAKMIAEDVDYNPPAGLDPDDTGAYARWLVEAREAAARGEAPAPMTPASIRGRDVIAELGPVGLDPETGQSARAAIAAAKTAKAAAEAEARTARDARMTQRAQARDADRRAREVATEGALA